jgi:uncharacterized cupin superfamily protein
MNSENPLILRAEQITDLLQTFSHPWNPNSEISGAFLGRTVGLKRVGAGDFMGFPTPSVAHHLRNTGNEDLVYLMGGETLEVENAEFPRLGKRMLRRGDAVEIYDCSDAKPFGPLSGETHA